jgi:hypothetical protein
LNLSTLFADGSANFQALLEDGERVFGRFRGPAYADGFVLARRPAAKPPAPATLDRLVYEIGLTNQLVLRQMAAIGGTAESAS